MNSDRLDVTNSEGKGEENGFAEQQNKMRNGEPVGQADEQNVRGRLQINQKEIKETRNIMQ